MNESIHLIPPCPTQRRKNVRRSRNNNSAAKKYVDKISIKPVESRLDQLRQAAQSVCWRPLEGIVGQCIARKYHKRSELVAFMAERLVARIEQVLA